MKDLKESKRRAQTRNTSIGSMDENKRIVLDRELHRIESKMRQSHTVAQDLLKAKQDRASGMNRNIQ